MFALPRLDDGKPYGTPDLRGESAIVVFWTAGCLQCAQELGLMQQVWQRHQGAGLNVLGVQIGSLNEPPAPGAAELNGVTFPNVRDASGAVAGAFGVLGTPEAYFIGSDWRVQAVDRGDEVGLDERRGLVIWSAIPEDLLLRRVAGLLSQEPAIATVGGDVGDVRPAMPPPIAAERRQVVLRASLPKTLPLGSATCTLHSDILS